RLDAVALLSEAHTRGVLGDGLTVPGTFAGARTQAAGSRPRRQDGLGVVRPQTKTRDALVVVGAAIADVPGDHVLVAAAAARSWPHQAHVRELALVALATEPRDARGDEGKERERGTMHG